MSTAPLTLRPYQREAVAAAVAHFRKEGSPVCLVLPTGAGKSLVIAELCRIARGSVLVLAHVKELCQQNYDKFRRAAPAQASEAGLYSAGLKARDIGRKITFGSVQSVARHLDHLERNFSLLIIDECHRLSGAARAQYSRVIEGLRAHSPKLFVLGLTATPYRLGMGWCYQRRMAGPYGGALVRTDDSKRPFVWCLYEVSLRHLLQQGHLTSPRVLDARAAQRVGTRWSIPIRCSRMHCASRMRWCCASVALN